MHPLSCMPYSQLCVLKGCLRGHILIQKQRGIAKSPKKKEWGIELVVCLSGFDWNVPHNSSLSSLRLCLYRANKSR